MPITTLDRCCPGVEGDITHLSGEPSLVRRLMELGFVPGTRVFVVKLAPLGDPLQVVVRGYHLSLRRLEAQCITLEVSEVTNE